MQKMKISMDFWGALETYQKVLTVRKKPYSLGLCEIEMQALSYSARITSILELEKDRHGSWCFKSVEGEKKPIDIFYEKLGFDDAKEMKDFYAEYLKDVDIAYLHCFSLTT